MNKKLTTLGLIAALGALLVGCNGCNTTQKTTVVTGPDNTVATNVTSVTKLDPTAATVIRGLVAGAVPFAVQKDTNAAPYLELASEAFLAAANDPTYDATKLQSALDRISVNELHDPTAQQIVKGALGFYKGCVADAVNAKIDATQYGPFLEDVLRAVVEGIQAGLSTN